MNGALRRVNSHGWAPRGLTPALLKSRGLAEMPASGIHTVTVPGAVAGWEALRTRLGTLPMADLLAAAIRYAELQVTLTRRDPDASAAMALDDLAMTYEGAGELAKARSAYVDAVRALDATAANRRDEALLADALEGAGRTALELAEMSDEGDARVAELAADGLATSERALVIARGLGESYQPSVDALDTQRGRALVALRRWKPALPILRAALERAEAERSPRAFSIAMRSFLLARTLWEIGDQHDRDHARVLSAQADTAFTEAHRQFAVRPELAALLQIIDRQHADLVAWRQTHV